MILVPRIHERILRLKTTSSIFPEEGLRLCYLASRVPQDGVIVELGSCRGRSACYLAAGLKEVGHRGTVYCVDLWELGTDTPERHHHPDAYRQFESNVRYCGLWDYIHPIKSDTVAASLDWKKPIDLLFIDAGHQYEEVLADYQAWSPFVKPGGVIAFHDYTPEEHPDIVRCVEQDVLPSGQWEFIALHHRVWTARRK